MADKRISDLTEVTSVQNTDFIPITIGGVGSYLSRKIQAENFNRTVTEVSVNQSLHGFSLNDFIRISGTDTYAKAKADTEANSNVVGIVTEIVDPDNFKFKSLKGAKITLSGLTANTTYYLSDTVAGGYTNVPPNTSGTVIKSLFISLNTSDAFFTNLIGTINSNYLTVSKTNDTNHFPSISSAIASISGASSTNLFIIGIEPGIYSEPELTIPSYVYIKGNLQETCIIEPDTVSHNVVNMSNLSGLYNVTIQNAGPGYYGINCDNIGDWGTIHKVSVSMCDIGLNMNSSTVDSWLYTEYMDFEDCTTGAVRITSSSNIASVFNAENLFAQYYLSNAIDMVIVNGNGAEANVQGCSFIGSGALIETAVRIINDGYFNISSARIEDFAKAFYVDNVGTHPYLKVQAIDFDGNTKNIVVDSVNCTGFYSGDYVASLFDININAPFYISNVNANILKVAKKGGQYTSVKAAVDSIIAPSSTNVYIVEIGTGEYIEDEITVPSYVYLKGLQQEAVKIIPSTTTDNVINLSQNTGLYHLTIYGADTGSTNTAINCTNVDSWVILHKVSVYYCDIGLLVSSTNTTNNYVYLEAVDFEYQSTNCIKIINTSTGVNIVQSTQLYFDTSALTPMVGVLIDGNVSEFDIQGLNALSESVSVDTAFQISNGGKLTITNGSCVKFNKAFYVDSSGSNPYLDIRATILTDNIKDVVIENTTCDGLFVGEYVRTKFDINSSCSWYVSGVDSNIVTVSKKGGQFTSIKSAVDFISDNSSSNKYEVLVGPGLFIEDTITLKNYVSIIGQGRLITGIQSSGVNQDVFSAVSGGINCDIRNMHLQGCTGVGKYVLNSSVSPSSVLPSLILFSDCDFGSVYGVVKLKSNGAYIQVNVDRCATSSTNNATNMFDVQDDGIYNSYLILSNCQFADPNIPSTTNIITAHGIKTAVNIYNCAFNGAVYSLSGRTGIIVYNGTRLSVLSCSIVGFDTAIWNQDSGVGCDISIQSALISYCNNHIKIDSTTTIGYALASCEKSKVSISSDSFTINITDTIDGSISISGDLYLGSTFSSLTNYSPILQKGQTSGAISGGIITIISGREINVSSGTGYLIVNEIIRYVTWNSQNSIITPNIDVWIYIDLNGIVQQSISLPNIFDEIILSKARADDNKILYLQNIEWEADATNTKQEKTLRFGLGAIYSSGSIVTANATARHLNVSSGIYYYGTHEYLPTGGNYISWTEWHRDGEGGWITSKQSNVDNAFYDNNSTDVFSSSSSSSYSDSHSSQSSESSNFSSSSSESNSESSSSSSSVDSYSSYSSSSFSSESISTESSSTSSQSIQDLTPIPTGYYAKHSLYIVNDGIDESYHLVYAQATYAQPLNAQNAPIATPPSTWSANIVRIATIIVQEGTNAIVEIRDERPRLGFTASAASVVTNHGDLTNLTADDHSQYLLVSGTRAMTGNLDMGTKNVTNVGTVDGVTVSSHASRHNPNSGSDAIATAAPTTNLSPSTSNSEGSASSLARSDHSHALSLTIPGGISISVDGNGSAITTGKKGWGKIPYSGTITSWDITGDQAGTCSVSIEKCSYANFPTFTSISAAAPITLTTALKNTSSTLTGWTISFTEGDYIRPSVDSTSVLTKIGINLQTTRS